MLIYQNEPVSITRFAQRQRWIGSWKNHLLVVGAGNEKYAEANVIEVLSELHFRAEYCEYDQFNPLHRSLLRKDALTPEFMNLIAPWMPPSTQYRFAMAMKDFDKALAICEVQIKSDPAHLNEPYETWSNFHKSWHQATHRAEVLRDFCQLESQ